MPIYQLDAVRNARIDRQIEPALEALRLEIAAWPFELGELGDISDVLESYDMSRARLNVLISLLKHAPDSTGLDIGTGLGFLPVLLARFDVTAIATERDLACAQFASGHGIDVRPNVIGRDPTPFPPESFDFLVLSEVLEHIKMPPIRILSELVPMLRPGGRFLLTTPNVARLSHLESLLAGENFLESFDESIPLGADATDYVEHVREYSIREVVEAVEGAGLEIEKVLMTGWGEAGYEPVANPYMNEITVVVAHH